MSREIKFRAWRGSSYMYPDTMQMTDGLCLSVSSRAWTNTQSKGIEQYTGLKDRNGVEIYEGDIVRLVDLGLGDMGCYEVEFNDDSAGFLMYFNQEIRYFIDHLSEEEIEVIGNIYETPELLEVK